jgi:hypothetical protein
MTTSIFLLRETGHELVGNVGPDHVIYRLRWGEPRPVGRVVEEQRIFRSTTHGEREVGQALLTGEIRSAGLLEGGALGWMEPDGVVIQGGLILGEQEIGRVEGPDALAAAAALLLIFHADEEEGRRAEGR